MCYKSEIQLEIYCMKSIVWYCGYFTVVYSAHPFTTLFGISLIYSLV